MGIAPAMQQFLPLAHHAHIFVVEDEDPTRSVTVTVSVQVPTAAVGPTVTIPVTESIVIPVIVGESEKRQGPVPFVRAKAVDFTVRPKVEVTFEPPVIPTAVLTIIVKVVVPVAPTSSVAVIVS